MRDHGCDLGVCGYEINGAGLVHHINPMVPDDIMHAEDWIINPEFLITTTKRTHNGIHYGDRSVIPRVYTPRQAGDTRLW